MAEFTYQEPDDGGYRAALAFFIAVEHTPMDDEHNEIADALVDEFGPDENPPRPGPRRCGPAAFAPRACQWLRLWIGRLA
jgi:hypothetical protein